MENEKDFEFFPKDQNPRVYDAYLCLILLGTFGVHQFYIGNKRRGKYLLLSCGFSHALIFLMPFYYFTLSKQVTTSVLLSFMFAGYAIAIPVLLWDLVTLPKQINGRVNREAL